MVLWLAAVQPRELQVCFFAVMSKRSCAHVTLLPSTLLHCQNQMADVPATLHEVAAKTSDEDTNEVLAARLAMATKLANYPDW